MNSYDLAAWLETCTIIEPAIFNVISKKLRAQHDELADLKTTVKFLEEECKAMRAQLK